MKWIPTASCRIRNFYLIKLSVPWNLRVPWNRANLIDSNSSNLLLSTSNILLTKTSLNDSWSAIYRACICMQLRALHCIRTCSIHAPGLHTRLLAFARALTHTLHTCKNDHIDKGSNKRAVAPFTQLEIQDTHAQLSSGFKTKTTVRNHANYRVTQVLKDCSLTVLSHMPRWESCFMEAQSTVWW